MGEGILGPGITIRPVQIGDESFLLRVYASSRAEELRQTGWTEAEKQTFVEMQFAAQIQDYSIRFPDSEQSIVLNNGTPAGRLWINRSKEEIRLLDITMLPEFRNTGIGTILLQHLQEEAKASARPLHHAVYKDNIDALRFYERLGFTIIEDYDTYCLMEWTNIKTE
jgi:ribosomal protein S18 acetylase RimI-like enzyme